MATARSSFVTAHRQQDQQRCGGILPIMLPRYAYITRSTITEPRDNAATRRIEIDEAYWRSATRQHHRGNSCGGSALSPAHHRSNGHNIFGSDVPGNAPWRPREHLRRHHLRRHQPAPAAGCSTPTVSSRSRPARTQRSAAPLSSPAAPPTNSAPCARCPVERPTSVPSRAACRLHRTHHQPRSNHRHQ